jgi:hypothetical protein
VRHSEHDARTLAVIKSTISCKNVHACPSLEPGPCGPALPCARRAGFRVMREAVARRDITGQDSTDVVDVAACDLWV